MSVTLSQSDINALIDVIKNAETPGSITNTMVASVLDYLNTNQQVPLTTDSTLSLTAAGLLSLSNRGKLALLIDEWKNEMGADGGYNETSGLFTAYDILDLTAAEVMTILGWRGAMLTDSGMAHYTPRVTPRTVVSAEGKFSMAECWINCSGLQVISNIHGYNYITARDLSRTWAFCTALRTIKPVVYCSQLISCDDTFKGCAALQDVKIEMIDRSISFADSPMLTTSSVAHLVEHSANTAPITVTLHPTAYGNLTQDILTLADQNRITFATV